MQIALSLSLTHTLSGHGQGFQCFLDATFGCTGSVAAARDQSEQCCTDGFLAFQATGDEGCTLCFGKL